MKSDLKLLKTKAFNVDSAKYVAYPLIFISDVINNENPKLVARLIHYPKMNKVQVCLAVSGKFHAERLSYWESSPFDWKERIWVYVDVETVRKILSELKEMI